MLKIEKLSSGYGPLEAIHGISLTVEKGEIVAVLGSNGAGKTTLLKTISGLIRLTKGHVSFEGTILNNLEPPNIVKLGIIHIPEGRRIFPGLTVRENLTLAGYYLKKNELDNRIKFAYSIFPLLKEREKQSGGTLSGGEQQMLALARGLIPNPKLLLMDEPSLGLAPKLVSLIYQTLEKLKKNGITILLVEQNAKKALEVSDRAYVLTTGYLTLEGTSRGLMSNENVKKLYLGR